MNRIHWALAHPATAPLFLASTIVGALALQHLLGWLPCPLCILQRLTALALLGALALHTVQSPRLRAVGLWVGFQACAFGLLFAGAHLWMLAFPAEGTCGPGLALFTTRLVEALPGSAWLLEGAGACANADYAIFGLPLPAWSALAHAGAMSLALHARRQSK